MQEKRQLREKSQTREKMPVKKPKKGSSPIDNGPVPAGGCVYGIAPDEEVRLYLSSSLSRTTGDWRRRAPLATHVVLSALDCGGRSETNLELLQRPLPPR